MQHIEEDSPKTHPKNRVNVKTQPGHTGDITVMKFSMEFSVS